MKDLFVIDKHDYSDDATIYTRPSVRGIAVKNGRALLLYSPEYDFYSVPGGGIEDGETMEEALVREMAEETGYQIIPTSISDFGRVVRKNKDRFTENGVFVQENYYYFCEVSDVKHNTKLEAYEAEEGITAVWMDLLEASGHNYRRYRELGDDMIVIKREAKVLDMADAEYRKRERVHKEAEYVEALGKLDYAGMLNYVEKRLAIDSGERTEGKVDIDYSRFEHTKRVLGWAKKLYDLAGDKDHLRYEDVIIATIFHDVGRNCADSLGIPHALAGVPITREYLTEHGFEEKRIEYICGLVAKHSDKQLMKNKDIDRNLLLLMEADLMDDMGALGIVMDCMIVESRNSRAHFYDCLDHIRRYTHRLQKDNPMVTEEARRLWDEKTVLTDAFEAALSNDIELI